MPTPIGNLEDITIRALGALKQANIILCEDTRVAKKLLELLVSRSLLALPADMDSQVFIESKQFLSFHSHNQDDFIASLDKKIFNSCVLYLSDAGTPCISDPGAKLISYAIMNNIDFDILPGACALNVAFCGSGIESTPFVFLGFLPHKKLERQNKIAQIAKLRMEGAYSVICYESPHRILDTLEDIDSILPSTYLSVQKELTKLHQQRFYGKAREIKEKIKTCSIRGEWVIVFDFTDSICEVEEKALHYEDVYMLDIPPKIKAKILSKMSSRSTKQCYEELLDKERMK
ncbi:16S rRNA (cytidine(1402)-2'-O)-methyltransferase [Helicobacter japonicus]|uniref:16S rRNA (cytidine(1402)-2'-O)-methyltransferase n=2 Tax=Helicobacter japonicus TaxID=425400 RepID=UPI001F286738|nr:16S rRNA (cytidine(1402)-2'-O)-methyltransferase [Helicobacter japonicus]